ncbi:hypothetical protein HanPI659440_Chr17g0678821 [Helianthus annuus]|nr:hypothetical protein HanPI659440_Chr17g0678821 [Helianthus annuus]
MPLMAPPCCRINKEFDRVCGAGWRMNSSLGYFGNLLNILRYFENIKPHEQGYMCGLLLSTCVIIVVSSPPAVQREMQASKR